MRCGGTPLVTMRDTVATHALAECYAVLTALPLERRVLPAEARQLIAESITGRLQAIQLTAADYHEVLQQVAGLGLVSGAVYDALHAHCARKAKVDRLLTYNVTHFKRFVPPSIVVTGP